MMTIKHIMKQRCRFHNIQTLMILLLLLLLQCNNMKLSFALNENNNTGEPGNTEYINHRNSKMTVGIGHRRQLFTRRRRLYATDLNCGQGKHLKAIKFEIGIRIRMTVQDFIKK